METTLQYDRKIINLLVDAFQDNERIQSMLRIPNRKNFKALFSYCYHYTKEVGHVYYSKEGNTAILYVQNSKKKALYTFTLWMMKLIVFSFNWSKLVHTMRTNRIVKKVRANAAQKFGDKDFLYIWFMGGKNTSNTISGMKGMLKVKNKILLESEKRNLPIYLETTLDRMVPLYENYGFEFYHKETVGDITIHFAKNNHHGK